jgi:hypothetical protein
LLLLTNGKSKPASLTPPPCRAVDTGGKLAAGATAIRPLFENIPWDKLRPAGIQSDNGPFYILIIFVMQSYRIMVVSLSNTGNKNLSLVLV